MLNDRETKLLVGLAVILITGGTVRLVAARWPHLTPGVVVTAPDSVEVTAVTYRGRAARDSLFTGGRLDVNRAGVGELVLLPGIGPALAGRIVGDREASGPFTRVEELARVRGIGPKTIERLRPLVTVE